MTHREFRFMEESGESNFEVQKKGAVEMMYEALEYRPSLSELPKKIDIGGILPFAESAKTGKNPAVEESIFEVLHDLRALEDHYGVEFSATVSLSPHSGKLEIGPYNKGEKNRVKLVVPQTERISQTASGLYIVEQQRMLASLHTHRTDGIFSLTDLYAGLQNEEHMYLTRGNSCGIDLIVRTQESDRVSRGQFEKFLEEEGRVFGNHFDRYAEQDVSMLQKRNSYIMDVILNKLHLGLYSNHGQEHSATLKRIIST